MLTLPLAGLTLLALALLLWQWTVALRFPLHRRTHPPPPALPVSVLKPLQGCDPATADCLRSWLEQDYPAPVQFLFGVASPADPACDVVRALLARHPEADAQLVVCPEKLGPNAKVSTLVQLERHARHQARVISDADVWVPPGLLREVVAPLRDPDVGLVHCFYRLTNPSTLAMQWEAFAINADFWSQVLQARSLRPLDFALGAVMATTQAHLDRIGGLASLLHHLADDYQLGHRIAASGARVELCPVVVECHHAPMRWTDVWHHQLRWARTIRACQPIPYFFSLLGNATLWPALWLLATLASPTPSPPLTAQPACAAAAATLVLLLRILAGAHLQTRLTRSARHLPCFWMAPVKDLLQCLLWGLAFAGNQVRWRGQTFRVGTTGRLIKPPDAPR
ncbi:MAG: bacteriohopanetetrol glucosamine biosynthesis glycosyltransferase HpnI [Verrucomicrobia bacterium]|nr:bacteriohopanetetrol glucosamine biosynthesis glycosyltransferase HpnI [Verrucomicrobiota bacterium]